MPDTEDNEEETEDDELDIRLKDTMQQLEEAESEFDSLEKEFLQLSKASEPNEETTTEVSSQQASKDLENVKVSVTNISPGGDTLDTEQTNKIVKKLEGTIRDKLSKLGLDTGGRPIEVKLITTQIPEGLGDGMEGDGEDMQVQGMFYNMMTGNVQGYEDINTQRKVENNYKFSWSEDLVDDIENKIEGLGGEDHVVDGGKEIKNENEPEEIVLTNAWSYMDIYEGGDQKHRTSSVETQANDDTPSDIMEDEIFTDEDEDKEQSKDEL